MRIYLKSVITLVNVLQKSFKNFNDLDGTLNLNEQKLLTKCLFLYK